MEISNTSQIWTNEHQILVPSLLFTVTKRGNGVIFGFNYFQVTAAAAGLSLLALGVYSAKRGTGVLASYVSARLGKPSLVRDTSRFSVFETLKHPINTIQKLRKSPQDALSGIVLEPGLESR